jgi:hypothetical protein
MATGSNVTFDGKIGWYTGGNSRSTFDVIWSCVAVILACTYKVIHLKIPPEEPAWRRWRRRFKWMAWMALSPEILLSMAMRDWLYARESVRRLSYLTARPAEEKEFGLCRRTTGIFMSKDRSNVEEAMGAKVGCNDTTAELVTAVEETSKEEATVNASARPQSKGKSHDMLVKCPEASEDAEQGITTYRPAWTTVHALYAEIGGYVLTFHKTHPPIPLFGDQIRVLIEEFDFEIHLITKDDINDRSKADPFTKAFAIIQFA